MRRAQAFSTVNWRKYLDVNTNPRAENFLKSKGEDVLWQISSNIRNSIRDGISELVLLVHPNVGGVIKIEQTEFKELLELSLNFFLQKEDYERCSTIQVILDELNNTNSYKDIFKNKVQNLI